MSSNGRTPYGDWVQFIREGVCEGRSDAEMTAAGIPPDLVCHVAGLWRRAAAAEERNKHLLRQVARLEAAVSAGQHHYLACITRRL